MARRRRNPRRHRTVGTLKKFSTVQMVDLHLLTNNGRYVVLLIHRQPQGRTELLSGSGVARTMLDFGEIPFDQVKVRAGLATRKERQGLDRDLHSTLTVTGSSAYFANSRSYLSIVVSAVTCHLLRGLVTQNWGIIYLTDPS